MGIPIIGDVINAAKDIISEVIVDKDKKIEANIRLKELEDRFAQRAHEEVQGQLEVNKVEASHSSVFVAGWRPAAGWMGVIGLGWAVFLRPLAEFIATLFGYATENFPVLDTSLVITILGGMLGLGGFRTIEKIKGVAQEKVTGPATLNQGTTVEVNEKGEVSVETSPNIGIPGTSPKKKKKFLGIF